MSAIQDRYTLWRASAIGRAMNPDNYAGYQCKDVIDDYAQFLWAGKSWRETVKPNDAAFVFDGAPDEYWDKIENDPYNYNQLPQQGDVIIWNGWASNPAGHIAVVDTADVNGVTVVEQDGFAQTPAKLKYWGWNVLQCRGWLRPKLGKPTVSTGATRVVTNVDGVNGRVEPNTSQDPVQSYGSGDVLTFSHAVRGGDPYGNGNNIWFVGAFNKRFFWSGAFDNPNPDGLTVYDWMPPTTPLPEPQPTPTPVPADPVRPLIIDISNHQRTMPLSVIDGVDGVIIKAGHTGPSHGGLDGRVDPMYKTFVDYARSKDKAVGHYWYFYPSEGAAVEASRFVAAMKSVGIKNGEPIFLDAEEPDVTVENIREFMVAVTRAINKPCRLYTNEATAARLGLTVVDWYAHYSLTAGTYNRASIIHQYTSTGRLAGYNGNLDMNVAQSLDRFRALGNILPVVSEPQPGTPPTTETPPQTDADVPSASDTPKVEGMKALGRNGVLAALSALIAALSNWALSQLADIQLPADVTLGLGGTVYAAFVFLDRYIHQKGKEVGEKFRGIVGF